MAFGAVRKAYKAPARFFADDPAADNQIIWYIVPDDTEIYDDWTVFTPRVDTPPNEATNAYEREGLGRIVRTFYDGVDVYGFPGTHSHGDPEDFRGLALRKKYFVGDVPPLPPCPDIRAFVRFAIGVECPEEIEELECACNDVGGPAHFNMRIDAPDYPAIDGRVVFINHDPAFTTCAYHGTLVMEDETEIIVDINCASGIDGGQYLFEVSWVDSPYGFWFMSGGLFLDDFTFFPWGFRHTDHVYVDLLDSGNFATLITIGYIEPLRLRFAIGMTVEDGGGSVEGMNFGMAVGLAVVNVETPVEGLGIGLAVGVETIDVVAPIEGFSFGLAVGMEATDP